MRKEDFWKEALDGWYPGGHSARTFSKVEELFDNTIKIKAFGKQKCYWVILRRTNPEEQIRYENYDWSGCLY
jgi:hypothetical protein